MKPDAGTKRGDHAFFAITDWFEPVVAEVEATDVGQVLGSVTIERRFAKPGIHCAMITEDGIDGFLCDPGDGRRHPGVMVLSEGRLNGCAHVLKPIRILLVCSAHPGVRRRPCSSPRCILM